MQPDFLLEPELISVTIELNKLIRINCCSATQLLGEWQSTMSDSNKTLQHEGVKLMAQDKNQTNDSDEMSKDTQAERGKTDITQRTPKETGGPKGPEPTRYGDWERKGRCIDF